jgi:hypothetical protein
MPEQLLQAVGGLSTARPPIECRVYPRLSCEVATSCQPTSAWGRKDSRWSATISDVSPGGIRLIVRRRFEAGAGLGIELPGRDGEEPYTVLAKVIHVQPLPDGSWALGCKFISELSEDELQNLASSRPLSPHLGGAEEAVPAPLVPSQHPKAVPSPTVRADAGRRTLQGVTLLVEIPPGRIVDCRIRSLSVPKSWPPADGKTLTMLLDNPRGPRPRLQVEVVRSRVEGERWTLLCRLVSPSWQDLLRALGRATSPGSGSDTPA